MRNTILTIIVLSALLCFADAQQWKRAGTTRYWDCSKPHCAWNNIPPNTHASETPYRHEYAFQDCNGRCAMGAKFFGTAAAATSIMGGWNGATAACGKCYALRAVGTSTPQIILQVNNLCPSDTNEKCKRDHFDIAVPGFDWNEFSVSNTCQKNDPSINYRNGEQICMRTNPASCDCNAVSSDPVLQAGCRRFTSLNWNNQEVDYTEVECPNLNGGGSAPPPSSSGSPPRPPPPPPSGGNCNGITYAHDGSDRWWVEINVPAGGRVQFHCSGSNTHTIDCTSSWGKYQCKPSGACLPDWEARRHAIVNGQWCPMTNVRAEYDDETNFGSFDTSVEEQNVDAAVSDNQDDATFVAEQNVDAAVADNQDDNFVAEQNVDAAVADNQDATFVAESAIFTDAAMQDYNEDENAVMESYDAAMQDQEELFAENNAAVAGADSTMNTEQSTVFSGGLIAVIVIASVLFAVIVVVSLMTFFKARQN